MFVSRRWAAAFVNSLEAQGADPDKGLNALELLAAWVKSLPGAVSGSSAAEKLETLIRQGMTETGLSDPSLETALRFIALMVRKNVVHHVDSVIEKTKKYLDRKNGIVHVHAEYAHKPGDDFNLLIEEAVKRKTGAVKVILSGQVNPELIGGYKLRIEDTVIDASIKTQLIKLESFLAAAVADPVKGGT